VAPGIPRLWPAMAHQDNRTGSGLGQMHSNAISFHKSMRNSHCSAPVSSTRLRLGFIGVDCLVMAPLRHTDRHGGCLLIGANRKWVADDQINAFDPLRTFLVRSGKVGAGLQKESSK